MSDSYTDITIVEANRLHSEEAKINNNENTALWQNNLQDIVHLEAGDKVSVQGAMISERGAGQGTSIEIKGQSLGFTKTFEYTEQFHENACDTIPSLFETVNTFPATENIEIRDDELNFTTNYFISANGHNQISLPRRWFYYAGATPGFNWGEPDSLTGGMTYYRPFRDNFAFYDDYYQIVPTVADNTAGRDHFKIVKDNSRYTIMDRDSTYFSASSASGNLPDEFKRDPENAIYRTRTELKQLKIRPGFNSPEFVAEELTRQLQKITEEKIYEFRAPADKTDNVNLPGFPIRMYKTISTETYKPFTCAYSYLGHGNSFNDYTTDFNHYYFNGSGATNASGFAYLSQYATIATKRPELYETGRLCNRFDIAGADRYAGILGADISGVWSEANNEITIGQDYTEENCRLWKAFFDAQDLYPEIWNTFSDSRSGYAAGDTKENSRWFHMNRFVNASMSFNASRADDAMLGYSGYKLHSWNPSEIFQPGSAICPVYYDPTQKDKFYPIPPNASNVELEPDQWTFGCMKCSTDTAIGRIKFRGSLFNGANPVSAFFNMMRTHDTAVPKVVRDRKLGFDMHFSAPGMAYMLPFAGYGFQPNSYSTPIVPGTYNMQSGFYNTANAPIGTYSLDSVKYRDKLYIGADAPKINFNGTNFTLSDLHTGMNRGNNNVAGNPYSASLTDYGDGIVDTESSTPVYKINPQEQMNDYTPDRKPYTFIRTGTAVTGHNPKARDFNTNLQGWTIYDALCGIFIKDINLTETEWVNSLWDILGFSYKQFNGNGNNRNSRITNDNINNLSIITTNADIKQTDSKIYVQNQWEAPLFNNMLPQAGTILTANNSTGLVTHFPEILKSATSVNIVADNLPTRMIRGYYTIRSNLLENTPFIGGKKNNTLMPVIGIVNKINGAGDFYSSYESDLQFTVTKPLRLASITVSIHDPDGSFARCSEQSAVLFKIQKPRQVTYNVLEELIEQEQESPRGRSRERRRR